MSLNDCLNWAQDQISATCQANDLPLHSVLLFYKGEGHKSGLLESSVRVCQHVEVCVTNEKLYVFEEEWMFVGVAIIISIFAWP